MLSLNQYFKASINGNYLNISKNVDLYKRYMYNNFQLEVIIMIKIIFQLIFYRQIIKFTLI